MIAFTVYGKPQTAGSKRAFPFKRKNGSLGVAVSDDNPKARDWKALVADACRQAYGGPLLTGPLRLSVTFHLPRPKGHYGTGKNSAVLKPDAPKWHSGRGDTTKLLRAVEDALNGVLWLDDGQVSEQIAGKRYSEQPCAYIEVEQMVEL